MIGTIVSADEAAILRRCGIRTRPWLGSAVDEYREAPDHIVTVAPANALARLGAYRIALVCAWPPLDGEEPEAHAIRKVEGIAQEAQRTAALIVAACGRGEL